MWIFMPRLDPHTREYNVDRYAIINKDVDVLKRPGIWANGGHEYITPRHDIHNWLLANGEANYHVHNSTTSKMDYHYENEGLDVWIDDPKVAVLFKLTYGGPKEADV